MSDGWAAYRQTSSIEGANYSHSVIIHEHNFVHPEDPNVHTQQIEDDAMGEEDDEEESDAVVNQVLDELGLQLNQDLAGMAVPNGSLAVATPGGKQAVPSGAVGGATDADADLQARLDDLRRE
eukprot:snap_masked-scaffold1912_size25034-processed-gene-0.4 protein:Tk11193 transcript:snap_masked-scaffold1912_size25034-processed-gene-0.4-mRNA-1 annotation:"hypothetical protein DAPPUDRAFT_215551"